MAVSSLAFRVIRANLKLETPNPKLQVMQSQPTWRIWILLWAICVLQTTWLARVEIFGAHLDLPLLATVAVALLLGSETGAVFGFVAGALTGIIAGSSLGAFILSRLVIGAAFGFFDRKFSSDNPLAPPLCAAAATLLSTILLVLIAPDNLATGDWALRLLAKIAVSAVFIWPMYFAVNRLVPPARTMI
jgi:rod shape-determining protein MreD